MASNNTHKKKATPKKSTAKRLIFKKKSTSEMTSAQRQKAGLILFVVSLFLAFLTFIPGESIWLLLHKGLLGLFGYTSILVPILLCTIAVLLAFDKTIKSVATKLHQVTWLIALISAALYVFTTQNEEIAFFRELGTLFMSGINNESAGLCSGLLGIPFIALLGTLPAKITLILLSFLCLMLLTGTSLIQLFAVAKKPAQAVTKSVTEYREQRVQKKKFNLDVALSDEDEKAKRKNINDSLNANESFIKLQNAVGDTLPTAIEDLPNNNYETAYNINIDVDYPETADEPIPTDVFPVEMDVLPEIDVPADIVEEPITEVDAHEVKPENVKAAQKDEEQQQQTLIIPEISTPVIEYSFPPITLLEEETRPLNRFASNSEATGELLINTLHSFGVEAKIVNITCGPTVTRYEIQPAPGVKISRITNLTDDIALNLASAGIRIEAPIPNKSAIGVEVPNKQTTTVRLRGLIDSDAFMRAESKLTVTLGRDISGDTILCDLSRMPHLLIAGSTGSGKSVCINTMIVSLLYKSSPKDVRLLMIDPKVVELGIYNGIPHLLVPVVTDPRKAAGALNWAVSEMLERYKIFASAGVRDCNSYNKFVKQQQKVDPECKLETMHQIVIIVDELADLMMVAPNEVEDAICRLAQMARAAGMHLVLATQRPSVDVITGTIKANIPSRIAFAVSSQVDSRTILDGAGAEKLLGRGDMLYAPIGSPKPTRLQGCFVSESEIEKIVEFIKNSATCEYDSNIAEEIDKNAVQETDSVASGDDDAVSDDFDPLFDEAVRFVCDAGQASVSSLQRRFRVGYARAGRLLDDMEQRGIVGHHEGSKPRQVLITYTQWLAQKTVLSDAKNTNEDYRTDNLPTQEEV